MLVCIRPGIQHFHSEHRSPDLLAEAVGDELVGHVLGALQPEDEGGVYPSQGLEFTIA